MLAPMFIRLNSMGIELSKSASRPILLYCNRVFSRPAFVKSMTAQEKNRYSNFVQR